MSMRVATFASSDSLLAAAMRVQSRQAEATLQQASGKVSTDYGGLGSNAGRVISLQSSIALSKSYASTASTANSRVQQMYDAVESMIDLLTEVKAQTASFDALTSDTDSLASTASGVVDQLVSLMNTKYDGVYLFAGSATSASPVDISGLTAQSTPTSADTTYYSGNDDILSAKVASDQTVAYGVTADVDAFEKSIRSMLLLGTGATDDDTVEEASDLIEDAITGLTTIQATLSIKSSTLESVQTQHEDYQTFAESEVSGLADVDVASVASKLSTYETQLEAAYSAIGTIRSLSLSSYLK